MLQLFYPQLKIDDTNLNCIGVPNRVNIKELYSGWSSVPGLRPILPWCREPPPPPPPPPPPRRAIHEKYDKPGMDWWSQMIVVLHYFHSDYEQYYITITMLLLGDIVMGNDMYSA